MIIVETTGLADPAAVARTILADADVAAFAYLDAVVGVVDAERGVKPVDERTSAGKAVKSSIAQLAFADRLVLNKCDLAPDEAALRCLETRLRAVNAAAPIRRATRGDVDVGFVVGVGAFDVARAAAAAPGFLDAGAWLPPKAEKRVRRAGSFFSEASSRRRRLSTRRVLRFESRRRRGGDVDRPRRRVAAALRGDESAAATRIVHGGNSRPRPLP